MESVLAWVLFDYAQVISEPQPPGAMAQMASLLPADPTAFEAAYWMHRDAYDRGDVSEHAYWSSVAGTLGVAIDDETLTELNEQDIGSWLDVSRDTLKVVRALRRRGVDVAILSNAPEPIALAVVCQEWIDLFGEHAYFSSQLRVTKPSPDVFHAVLARLGAGVEDVLFVDDRADNVAAAAALGMRTVHFRDADQLRAELTSAGLL